MEAAASLLHASERAVDVALEAIQALGGAGYLNESGAGRLLRDAKLYTIGAGTNEIRRMLIGRASPASTDERIANRRSGARRPSRSTRPT